MKCKKQWMWNIWWDLNLRDIIIEYEKLVLNIKKIINLLAHFSPKKRGSKKKWEKVYGCVWMSVRNKTDELFSLKNYIKKKKLKVFHDCE